MATQRDEPGDEGEDGEYRTSAAPPKPVRTPDDLDLVVLEVTHDPMRAENVRSLLESEGIVVATPGLEHRVVLGPLAGHVEIAIRVPRLRLRKAKRILAAYKAEAPVYDHKRRWRIAGFAAIAVPLGGGHLYAGAYASATVFALTQLLVLWASFGGQVLYAPLVAIAVVLLDLFGSREACVRANRALPVRNGWLSRGALIAFVAVPLALVGLHLWGPTFAAGPDGRALCAFTARCAEADEDECLREVGVDRLDGFGVADSRACIDCYDRDADCDDIVDDCWEICGWE